MEFVRNILRVKIYGESYELRFPTLVEVKKFSHQGKNDNNIDKMLLFLESLGLDKKVSEQMELPHLTTIIEALTAQKKS